MDRFNRPPPPANEATDEQRTGLAQNMEENDGVDEPELPPLSSTSLHVAPSSQEKDT